MPGSKLTPATVLEAKEDYAGAEAACRQAIQAMRELFPSDESAFLGNASGEMMGAYQVMLRLQMRKKDYESALECTRRIAAGVRLRKATPQQQATALSNVAFVLGQIGQREEEIIAVVSEAIALLEEADDQDATVRLYEKLMWARWSRGEFSQAEKVARDLSPGALEAPTEQTVRVAGLQIVVGTSLSSRGAFAEAEPLLRSALAIYKENLADDWQCFAAMGYLGEALTGLQQYESAEKLLLEGYRKIEPPRQQRKRKQDLLRQLIALYEKWGKKAEAARWSEQLAPDVGVPAKK